MVAMLQAGCLAAFIEAAKWVAAVLSFSCQLEDIDVASLPSS